MTPGSVSVETANDGTHYSSNGVLFDFLDPPLVLSITPTLGASTLSSTVTVQVFYSS